MTERLTTLLHREADGLDVPQPDAARILGDGRRARRRQALTQGAVGVVAAVLVLVAGGVAWQVAGGAGGRHRSDLPAASNAQLEGWAVASGSTVQLGSGRTVEVGGKVKSLYYTSAGVLVRYGKGAETDAPDSTYALIDREGEVSDFRLDLGDRVPGTSPTQPYLVYADAADDRAHWNIVVRDVRSGEVVRTVPVSGAFTWGGWVAPPVSLDGDHVYVGLDTAMLDVSVTTGAISTSALPPSMMPTVDGGRTVVWSPRGAPRVLDARTGATLLQVKGGEQVVSLSPDGRFAFQHSYRTCDEHNRCSFDDPKATVHDLATGRSIVVDVSTAGYGWTPEGDLLRVTDDAVDVCDPTDGSCRSTPVEVGGENLRLGGASYES